MEDGSQPPPPEGYEKPVLTKHDDLTQVTFSSHGGEPKSKVPAPATTTTSHSHYDALGYNKRPYEPGKYTLSDIQKFDKRK